jgi:hypothetical protein
MKVKSSVNFLSGVIGDWYARYYFLYYQPELLEDEELAVRLRMWCMHHGTPAHSIRDLRGTLKNLWTHLKFLICAAHVGNEEVLRHRIVVAYQTIRNCLGVFEGIRQSMIRYTAEACIESHREHFEHLL